MCYADHLDNAVAGYSLLAFWDVFHLLACIVSNQAGANRSVRHMNIYMTVIYIFPL